MRGLLKRQALKRQDFATLCNVQMDVIMKAYKICKPLVVYRFYCMALQGMFVKELLISIWRIQISS